MAEFRNRIITEYWTVELPDGWLESDRAGKPGVAYESPDGVQRMIINTFSPDPRFAHDPSAELSAFEDVIREANAKNLGESYAITFAQRSSHGIYLATTLAGFDDSNRMGICARRYVAAFVSIIVQVHHYDCESSQAFDAVWRQRLDGFDPSSGEG
jgi:hypothetical protein